MNPSVSLFENHLVFLERHRGTVTRLADAVLVESSSPEFCTLLPLSSSMPDELLERFDAVRLLPWSGDWAERLEKRGYVPSDSLSYMLLEGPLRAEEAPEVEVTRAITAADLRTFSEVQTRGFEVPAEEHETWLQFLGDAAQNNRDRPEQCFYTAHLAGDPVGVTLALYGGGLWGIYAVATLPSARRRGVSTALLSHAIASARAAGEGPIGLQVAEGSYAESFYRKLGFELLFRSPTWRRGSGAA